METSYWEKIREGDANDSRGVSYLIDLRRCAMKLA